MSVLVTGATGTIGSRVVEGLLAKGIVPRVLSRSKEKAAGRFPGAEVVEGDLNRLAQEPELCSGTDQLVLITPLSPDEEAEGKAAVGAAHQAGVRHVMLLSVHHAEQAPQVPHFRSKVEIAKEGRRLGLTLTEVMPNNFFQNDYWYRDAILQWGIYPQPLGPVGASRIDAGDIAEGMVRILTTPELQGSRYPMAGPAPISGEQVAAEYSRSLGRTIRYGGDDLEAWAEQSLRYLPEWLVEDLKSMYGFFQRTGLVASEEDLRIQHRLLGRQPRRFADFVDETCQAWLNAG